MSILTSSAAALPPAARLAQVCSSGFPAAGVEVVLRDAGGSTIEAPPPPPQVASGSTPLPLVVSRVGEVHIRGPTVFGGYTRRGAAAASSASLDAFTPDGFLRTGDLATWDGLGYLRVVGRCVAPPPPLTTFSSRLLSFCSVFSPESRRHIVASQRQGYGVGGRRERVPRGG